MKNLKQMLVILKWEAKKRFALISLVLIPFAVLVLLMLVTPVPPDSARKWFNPLLSTISIFFIFGGMFLTVLNPSVAIFMDYKSKYTLLERLCDCSLALTIVVKIILNIMIFLLGAGLLYLAATFMSKFNTENVKFLQIGVSLPLHQILLDCAIIAPLTATLAFVASMSISKLNKIALGVAVAIFLIVFIGIMQLNNLNVILASIIKIILALVMTVLSTYLYKTKSEVI